MKHTSVFHAADTRKPSALLMEGDCIELLSAIPDRSIDLILCDLPYGTTQNKWDSIIPLDRLWKQYNRIVSNDGSIILTSQGMFTANLMISNSSMFKYKYTWVKSKATNFLNAKIQPLRKHEDICVFQPKKGIYNPQMQEGDPYNKGIRKDQLTGSYGTFKPSLVKSDGMRYPSDVLYFKTAEAEGEVFHSTQKPVELARFLVRTYSRPNSCVLDNAFGSGSFLVGAALEGRSIIGMELNEQIQKFRQEKQDLITVAEHRLSKILPSEQIVTCRKNDMRPVRPLVRRFMSNIQSSLLNIEGEISIGMSL